MGMVKGVDLAVDLCLVEWFWWGFRWFVVAGGGIMLGLWWVFVDFVVGFN